MKSPREATQFLMRIIIGFTEDTFNLTPIVLWRVCVIQFWQSYAYRELEVKKQLKRCLFGFSTPKIGFKFWANIFFHDKLKMVHICPNFLFFVFTTYNIDLVVPLRDTQPATTTNFAWIVTKRERFITWCLQFETSFLLDMKPKVTCFCSSRRRNCHRKWTGLSTLFPR